MLQSREGDLPEAVDRVAPVAFMLVVRERSARFRPDEIEPKVSSWVNGVHPDDMPGVERALKDAFERRTSEYETEHRVSTKNGAWIWILDRGKVFAWDASGRPARMVGTELDVTERKKSEEALRVSEAKFSGLVSISADAILTIDEEQRIVTFNEGAERIFGYSKAEATGSTTSASAAVGVMNRSACA